MIQKLTASSFDSCAKSTLDVGRKTASEQFEFCFLIKDPICQLSKPGPYKKTKCEHRVDLDIALLASRSELLAFFSMQAALVGFC